MLMELEGSTGGGMGGEEQSRGCTNGCLGKGNPGSSSAPGVGLHPSGAVWGTAWLPLEEHLLPWHWCRLLADSRVSQPWTLTEQAI